MLERAVYIIYLGIALTFTTVVALDTGIVSLLGAVTTEVSDY